MKLVLPVILLIPVIFTPLSAQSIDNEVKQNDDEGVHWVKQREQWDEDQKKEKQLFSHLKDKLESCVQVELPKVLGSCPKPNSKEAKKAYKNCYTEKELEMKLYCEQRWLARVPVKYRPEWVKHRSKKVEKMKTKLKEIRAINAKSGTRSSGWMKEF